MERGIGSAPGKTILTGEHSVVYGYPALATALNLRCNVVTSSHSSSLQIVSNDLNISANYSQKELKLLREGEAKDPKFDNIAHALLQFNDYSDLDINLEITSNIPVGAGLGSSAAVSVASICSVAHYRDINLTKDQINQYAFKAEQITHGTPSGIDNSTATLGGLVHFEKGSINHKSLDIDIPLIILNTNIARNTKSLVKGVRERKEKMPTVINPILEAMGALVLEFENALSTQDFDLMGHLMTTNQYLLDSIGVGHPVISKLITNALLHGAYGAKLTGAGGGGCILVLTSEDDQKKIAEKLHDPGIDVLTTSLSKTGAKIGNEVVR